MSWHITLGYNSQGGNGDEEWEAVKKIVREIADNPRYIEGEARRIDPATCENCCINGFAENYLDPFTVSGHPITIDDANRQIIQWGCAGCAVKYSIRRAFIRLLIKEAHRKRIEVCLHVS